MEKDPTNRWRRFQRVAFDKKAIMKRMRRAEVVSFRHAHKFVLKRWGNLREVRGKIVFWIVALGCLIGATGLQLIWDQQNYQTQVGAVGGTYAEAAVGPIETLNPLFASSQAENIVSQLVFSRLLNYDRTGNLNYDAASDVSVSADGLEYSVKIRSDILWQDGRKLTADDVVFTTQLIQDPLTRSQIRGWDGIKVTKTGEYSVSFRLKEPYAPFREALTFAILPKHILGSIDHTAIRENSFGTSPIGSGPFSVRLVQDVDVSNGRRVAHLVTNKTYYRGAPKLERFQVHAYKNSDDIMKALSLNEVNAASGLTITGTKEVLARYGSRYNVDTQPIQAGVYAFLNTQSDVLSDVTIRRALQRATNTDEIRDKVGGQVESLSLPFTSLQVDASTVKVPSFDPAEANKLLDDAGWKKNSSGKREKDGKPLKVTVATLSTPEYLRALEVMIGQWRQVGVDVEEKQVDPNDSTQDFVQTVLQPRAYDVLLYQIDLGRDPDVYTYWHSSQANIRGRNLSNYKSAVADDILVTARSSQNSSLRATKYVSFAQRWLSDVPAIGLYQPTVQYIYNKSVGGLDESAVLVRPQDRYQSVIYWTVGDQAVYKTP